MPPDEEQFRTVLRTILERSGFSMRALSAAMGRDPGYIAALLDPSRPPRARPTPADLVAASDATGIAFVELLESLWGIDRRRLAGELGEGSSAALSESERASVADFVAFLASRHSRRGRPRG
jgi:transcriptional regulator with XRE-family HTH domain